MARTKRVGEETTRKETDKMLHGVNCKCVLCTSVPDNSVRQSLRDIADCAQAAMTYFTAGVLLLLAMYAIKWGIEVWLLW